MKKTQNSFSWEEQENGNSITKVLQLDCKDEFRKTDTHTDKKYNRKKKKYAICQEKKKNDKMREQKGGFVIYVCLIEIEKLIGYFKTAPILTS